jgi:hypothetical protein
MKEWRFEKYLSEMDMKIIVAKANKRAREQKKTVFFHHSRRLAAEGNENFKKRRAAKESIAACQSAGLFLGPHLWAKELASNYMDRNPGLYQLPDPASHCRYSSRCRI